VIEPLLAAGGLEGWIETIILLLVIGGSALASIAKPLIKKFGGQDPEESAQQRRERQAGRSPAARPRPAQPAAPVARPMPPRPVVPKARAAPTVATPAPVQPIPREPAEKRPPYPVRRPSVPLARPRPVEKPQRVRLVADHDLGRLEAKVAQRHLESAAPSRRVVHPKTEADHAATRPSLEFDRLLASIRHPTRTALRQAIVMSEILSPPVGLRPLDERI
jgi:hypothetical protein